MSAIRLNIVSDISDDNPEKFMNSVLRQADVYMPQIKELMIYGKSVKKKNAVNWLKKSRREAFSLEIGDWVVHAACVRRASVNVLYVENKATHFDWDWWVSEVSAACLVKQAWVVNSEYDHWQNAEDKLQYESVGRPWKHLPTKSNGLPYPLEQVVIDTSKNPGRFSFQDGYIEAVGSVMWLSEGFLRQVGSSIERISALSWVKVSRFSDDLWRVQSADEPFSDCQGESEDRQNALRSLVYSSASH